jgi:hypothetical protein
MTPDNRIGKLNNGLFYAYVDGYSQPPLTGTLAAIEAALGLTAKTILTENQRAAHKGLKAKPRTASWNVNLRFQHPPWDAPDGLWYQAIQAENKSCANATARRMARDDGHLAGGCGRATFTAHEAI